MRNKPLVQRIGRATSRTTMKVGGLFGKGIMRGVQDAFSEIEKEKDNDK